MTTGATRKQDQNQEPAEQEPVERIRIPIKKTMIDILDSWLNASEEEAREQKETGEYLKKALDERRPPGYKLFS